MSGLSGSSISKRDIEVYGVVGDFTIMKGKAGAPVKVNYFQTSASNNSNSGTGHSLALLRELKPMRERVGTSDLKDLRSLLQRDLSDFRIANELVPYLKGDKSKVGFFPSILVALLPKGFLTKNNISDYPAPIPNNLITSYGNNWSIERLEKGGVTTALSILSIDPDLTDLIVLDGQHRANAFRYLTGSFEDAVDDTKIYHVFYKNCVDPAPTSFLAELPVTIIWFESDHDIEPSLISRRLFVDVNTNARQVSEARNILLNDYEIASVATTNFYSLLAQSSFKKKNLSLLHSGFDCEGDQLSDYPGTTIFSPKTFHYMMSYFLLAGSDYLKLSKTISRDQYRNNLGKTSTRLKDFTGANDKLISNFQKNDSKALERIDKLVSKNLSPKIFNLIDGFKFLKPHFEACEKLNKYATTTGGINNETWSKVFQGGEGLFNAFKDLEESDLGSSDDTTRNYSRSVKELNSKVGSFRHQKQPNYNKAFQAFTSHAGFTGFFMAFLRFVDEKGWSDKTVEKFLNTLNKISTKAWVSIFTDYKNGVIASDVNPRLWTSYRLIFLRAMEGKSSLEFFDSNVVSTIHPDYTYCSNNVSHRIRNFINENEDKPSASETNKWIGEAIKSLSLILKSSGLSEKYKSNQLTPALKKSAKSEIVKQMKRFE